MSRVPAVLAVTAILLSGLTACASPGTSDMNAPGAAPLPPSATSSPTPTATPAPTPTGLPINSVDDLKAAWLQAGLPCATPKAGTSLHATATLSCDANTTLSYFATASALAAQDKAFQALAAQGLAKEEVLQGPTWTIQSTTENLRTAQTVLGGTLTDPAKAGL